MESPSQASLRMSLKEIEALEEAETKVVSPKVFLWGREGVRVTFIYKHMNPFFVYHSSQNIR